MNKLTTTRSDAEVFDTMGIFEMADSTRSSFSVRLQFPKFAHGFTITDFEEFIEEVGEENIVSLGRLSFPNEWQMTLSSQKKREELIRSGRTRINNRSCWIHPLSSAEIRGFVHWLPNEIPHSKVTEILRNFGDVLFIETQNYSKFNYKIASDARYFALYLKPGASKEDLPHFITISRRRALITIRGRQPACFHCREVGHRKNECKIYRERLGEYCLKTPGTSGRRGKRGKRHKPDVSNCVHEKENSEISATNLNGSANEVQNSMLYGSEVEFGFKAKQEAIKKKNKRKARRKKKNAKKENSSTVVETPAVEVIDDAQCEKNEDLVADSSKTSTEIKSSSLSSTSALQSLLNTSSTVETFSKSFSEEGHNLNFNVDTNAPSVLESENTLLKAEKVVPDQEKAPFVERKIQNPCDNLDQLNGGNIIEKHFSVSSENQTLECVDEKSISVSDSDIVAENSNEGVSFKNCLHKNFKNVCNDLAEMVHDSSTDSVCNNSQQISEQMQVHINSQISDILNSFVSQITSVLSEAGVVNVNEIKDKLLDINGTSLHSKKSDCEAKCNLIEHDKNSNVIEPSCVSKVSKKKKKKSKQIPE